MENILKHITVIINGHAGAGHDDAMAQDLRAKFAAHGMQATIVLARDGKDMIAAARAAVAGSVPMVAGGGGDGTQNAVAAQLVGSGIPYGVLPMGTLNHFAKDLGIPLDLDGAVRTIATGMPKQVDVGVVNEQVFLNNSSLGLYPDIVRDREKQQSRLGRGKWLAALWATVAALRRYPFLSVRMQADDTRLARRTPFVFIGNNEYTMEGLAIGARSRLDGGTLSLYVAQRPGRLGLLRFAIRALIGGLKEERDFDVLLAQEMTIETRHKHLHVAFDGEVEKMATPLRYRIRPGALTVMVPQSA
ncbi:diacylglycerol/lipid kinase family protein [Massilia sp. S19_KUP03_FR1]|uniref:diacylglycerol/lipid kinase family protein n=1 Tax=Massilia sp. S19_KUP03_FR1 TaxID=3025503 RepID=UPI002FCD9BE2